MTTPPILVPQPKKIAVTGHRPDKLGGYSSTNPQIFALKKHMRELLSLEENKLAITISGMALGVDQWWAEVSIELDIPFIAAIPFDGFHLKWPKESQERFRAILDKAYSIIYISPPPYHVGKMQKRNQWMVDNCTELLAYWDGTSGGTANCVKYAQHMNKKLTIINPRTL